jgi:hypothetical protein
MAPWHLAIYKIDEQQYSSSPCSQTCAHEGIERVDDSLPALPGRITLTLGLPNGSVNCFNRFGWGSSKSVSGQSFDTVNTAYANEHQSTVYRLFIEHQTVTSHWRMQPVFPAFNDDYLN